MPYTLGFDPELLTDHADRHRQNFGAQDEQEYEALADAFMGGPLTADMIECIRSSNGDRLRGSVNTFVFGVLTSGGTIRTYYVNRSWRVRYASFRQWFDAECRK